MEVTFRSSQCPSFWIAPDLVAAERVHKFKLSIAEGSEFASEVVYVYGIEPTTNLDELKLVVWGEEWVGWKAEELGSQTHRNENTDRLEDKDLPVKRWWITDEEPLNVIKFDKLTISDSAYQWNQRNDARESDAEPAPPPATPDNRLVLWPYADGNVQMAVKLEYQQDRFPYSPWMRFKLEKKGGGDANDWQTATSGTLGSGTEALCDWRDPNPQTAQPVVNRDFQITAWMDINRNEKWDAFEPHRLMFVTMGKLDKMTIFEKSAPANKKTDTTNLNTTPAPPDDLLVIWEDTHFQAQLGIFASWIPGTIDGKQLRWAITPATGWTNAGGDFSAGPSANSTWNRPTPKTFLYEVRVWADKNQNYNCDAAEQQRKLRIAILPGIGGWESIQAARTSAPMETLYPIKEGEHFEIGGTFKFRAVPFIGAPDLPQEDVSNVRYEFWDADYADELLKDGLGTEFHATLGADPNDRGYAYVKFRNGNYEVKSPNFYVMPCHTYNLTVECSNLTPLAALPTVAARNAAVQTLLSSNTDFLLTKDSKDDWRACVDIQLAGNVGIFAPSPARPDPAATQAQAYLHDASNFNVVIVNSMLYRGWGTEDTLEMAISWSTQAVDTMVHELGHNVGLALIADGDHAGYDPQHIMCRGAVRIVGSGELKPGDVDNYDKGPGIPQP